MPAAKNVLGRNATTSAFGSWQRWGDGTATGLGCRVDVTAGSSRLGLFAPVVASELGCWVDVTAGSLRLRLFAPVAAPAGREDGVEDDEVELLCDEDIFSGSAFCLINKDLLIKYFKKEIQYINEI